LGVEVPESAAMLPSATTPMKALTPLSPTIYRSGPLFVALGETLKYFLNHAKI